MIYLCFDEGSDLFREKGFDDVCRENHEDTARKKDCHFQRCGTVLVVEQAYRHNPVHKHKGVDEVDQKSLCKPTHKLLCLYAFIARFGGTVVEQCRQPKYNEQHTPNPPKVKLATWVF